MNTNGFQPLILITWLSCYLNSTPFTQTSLVHSHKPRTLLLSHHHPIKVKRMFIEFFLNVLRYKGITRRQPESYSVLVTEVNLS